MSETAWRRKNHYKTRVLIGTGDVLESSFEDALLCITGPQRNLLQNLTQYLHRRSTFVSEYGEGYYLAPTSAEWDDLQEVVADLEDKIMNCDEYTALLQAVLEAAQCACKGSGKGHTSPIIGPIYDDLEDDGHIEWTNPVTTIEPADEDMCALAQLVYQMAYEVLTEYVEPLQEALHETLLFLVLEALAVWLGGPLALVPGAAVYHSIQAFLDAWVEGELTNCRNELIAKQDELICAMYVAWDDGGDYGDAADAAWDVINASEAWSPIDKVLFRLWFSSWTMELCQIAWDEATDWATSSVTPGACDECRFIDEKTWTFPPCPGTWTLAPQNCTDGSRPTYASNKTLNGYSPTFEMEPGARTLKWTYVYHSYYPSGWTVGRLDIEQWNTVAEEWQALPNWGNKTWNTSQAPDTETTKVFEIATTITYAQLRIHMQPQAAQWERSHVSRSVTIESV